MLTYAKEHWETDFYLYCCFIVSAGLRPSEAYALTWGDLSDEPVSAISRDGKAYKMGLLSIDKATVRDPAHTSGKTSQRQMRESAHFVLTGLFFKICTTASREALTMPKY